MSFALKYGSMGLLRPSSRAGTCKM